MDNYRLYRDGFTAELGSYVQADPGPDFDFAALYRAEYSGNAAIEGGQLAYESSGVRRFKFPLIVSPASVAGASLGLDGALHVIRVLARPGAYVDLQPDGVATAGAIRFNVLDGRLTEGYKVPHQRVSRRLATLELDVEPFGYLATEIILASTVATLHGAPPEIPGGAPLTIPAGSIIGDVPGLARIVVQASQGAGVTASAYVPDMVAWALGGKASFLSQIAGGSFVGYVTASTGGNHHGFGSQVMHLFPSPTQGGWTNMAYAEVSSVLEPAYRGRYRIFGLARLTGSSFPWQVSLDVVGGLQTRSALASSHPVATVPFSALVLEDSGSASTTIAYAPHIVDLGEHTLPRVASGFTQSIRFRFWAKPATSNLGSHSGASANASVQMSLGGLFLLPLDGGAGILPRGLAQPSHAPLAVYPSAGRLDVDGIDKQVRLTGPYTSDLSTDLAPYGDGFSYYRGDLPRVVGSTIALHVLAGVRQVPSGSPDTLVYNRYAMAGLSVSYRPRFTFMRGI